jgi:hypothetical protein
MHQHDMKPEPEFMVGIGVAGVVICSGLFYDMNMHQCPENTDQCPKFTLILLLIILIFIFIVSIMSIFVGLSDMKYDEHTLKAMNTAYTVAKTLCIGIACTAGAYIVLPLLLHLVVVGHHHYQIQAGLVVLPAYYTNTENDRLVAGEWSFALATVIAIVVWLYLIATLCKMKCVENDVESGYSKMG